MSLELYQYQKDTVDRFSHAAVIPLFWEMSLGKTAIIARIAGEKFLRGEIDRLLYIAPNGVHKQNAKEIDRWLQKEVRRQVQVFGGRQGAREIYPWDKGVLMVLCINIDTFSTPRKWMAVRDWAITGKCFMVLDEATCVKSRKSARTQRILYEFNAVRRMGKRILSSTPKTTARAVLTGTPVTNSPTDLWPIMEFVSPNFFKMNWFAFNSYYSMHTSMRVQHNRTSNVSIDEERWDVINVLLDEERWNAIKKMTDYYKAFNAFGVSEDTFNTIHSQAKYQGPYKHADELKAKLDTIASFKRLDECVELPPRYPVMKKVVMSEEIEKHYAEMEEELITIYRDKVCDAKSKLSAIIRLQQICSGFLSTRSEEFDEDGDLLPNEITWIGESNPKLDTMYADIDETAKPVIIVTHFTAEAARIYNDLSKKYKTCLMTGWQKIGSVEEFQEGKFEVMVANVRVIAKGFNLQNSHSMFFYSNTFSLEDRLQVEGRIRRIGQAYPSMYADYVYEGTVDMKVVAALRQKRELLDYIRGASVESFLTEWDDVMVKEFSQD
jgi:hypothetical protein